MKGNRRDYVAVAMRGVEDTATVGEAALLCCEIDEVECFKIECTNLNDRVGNLLAVGSYVLDRCAANTPGDTCETLDSADSLLAYVEDEGVPFCAGGLGDVETIG